MLGCIINSQLMFADAKAGTKAMSAGFIYAYSPFPCYSSLVKLFILFMLNLKNEKTFDKVPHEILIMLSIKAIRISGQLLL